MPNVKVQKISEDHFLVMLEENGEVCYTFASKENLEKFEEFVLEE